MWLDEVAARLVAQSVGVMGTQALTSNSIFIGSAALIPTGEGADGPYLLLKDTGGSGSAKTQNNTATERPTGQISTRARSPVAAYDMAKAAYVALGGENGLFNITLSSVRYLSLVARTMPSDIGLDQEARPMFSFNIDAEKQPS
jgi:hypothetical protein